MGIKEIEHECKLLQELAEDMNLQEEVISWRKECKKLEYIREEFGNNKSAWEYVKGMFGKQGVLNDGDLRQMKKDIASIAKIHGRRSSSRERSPTMNFRDRRQGEFYLHHNPLKIAPGLCFECGSPEHFKRACPLWRGRGQRGREILKRLLCCKTCVLFELCWVYVFLISKVNRVHKRRL